MKVCGLCWCLFGLLFLISVIAKRTVFPRWCVIFNIMIFYPLLMMAGYPGYMSGGGYNVRRLLEKSAGAKVYGIDISEGSVKKAKKINRGEIGNRWNFCHHQ